MKHGSGVVHQSEPVPIEEQSRSIELQLSLGSGTKSQEPKRLMRPSGDSSSKISFDLNLLDEEETIVEALPEDNALTERFVPSSEQLEAIETSSFKKTSEVVLGKRKIRDSLVELKESAKNWPNYIVILSLLLLGAC